MQRIHLLSFPLLAFAGGLATSTSLSTSIAVAETPAPAAAAAAAAAARASRIIPWQSGEMHEFQVAGRAAKLVYPKNVAPGRPWIWRTEFFGHEPQADAALLAAGWHVAYINMENLYGGPAAMEYMDAFYGHLVKGRGLASKVVLEGFSRGGLFTLNWGIRNPTKVSSIYNDAPVCDFTTWPKEHSPADWQRMLKAYGVTEAEALTGKLSPIHNLAPLAKAKVPLLHICGDADETVPFSENTQKLAKIYEGLGGSIQVIAKPGVKHHPHSLPDPKPIVDFVLANFKPSKLDVPAEASQPAVADVKLPNVLIIGDSISIGYTPPLRKLLEGKANVWRIPVNGGPTTNGLANFDAWLEERRWDVIHFNWGLHDLKHVGQKPGQIVEVDAPGAHHQVALADYKKNLTELVTRLKATGAALIWADTTPSPEGASGRRSQDVTAYNAAAQEIMTAQGITIDPLNAAAADPSKATLQLPKNVHYTEAGSAFLAEKVAAVITNALNR